MTSPRPPNDVLSPEVRRHLGHLHTKVFNPGGDYPQFAAMLDAMEDWAAGHVAAKSLLVLERAYIYGGTCLFAPLFERHKVTAMDCHLASTKDRYGFNSHMADSPDVIRRPPDAEGPIWELPFADDSFDHVVCPNVVHHVRDQASMISEWERVLKPGGTGFLFEALVRELHQVPDDYLRYTPFGMKAELEKRGLDVVWWKPTTDVFDVIRYCFLQAFQNFPSDRSADTEEWVRNEVFPRLSRWSEEYPSNLKNPAKSFPTGFLLEFRKPESLETT